jgi:flagellar M-ring protein FliF
VLVDQAVRWEGSGKQQKQVVTPPSAETVRAIRVLVSGAIGLQPDRGDQLVVESLPFESTLQAPAPVENTPAVAPNEKWTSITDDPRYIGAAGGGLLLLLVLVIYKRNRSKRQRVKATAATALPEPAEKRRPLPAADAARSEHLLDEGLEEFAPAVPVAKLERLVTSVKTAASDDPALVAGVLRNWLEER